MKSLPRIFLPLVYIFPVDKPANFCYTRTSRKKVNLTSEIKLDYSITSPEERTKLVRDIIDSTPPEELTPVLLTRMSDYIIYAMDKQERKKRTILTDNRLTTINKRETSYEGLVAQLESGEDGVYNLISSDGRSGTLLLTHKISITQEDINSIPELKQLRESIDKVEEQFRQATGRDRYLLKKQLIEMRKDQYVIKYSRRPPVRAVNLVQSVSQISLDDEIAMTADGRIVDNSMISLTNPTHISLLLCNYSKLKEAAWDKMESDIWCLLLDLENLTARALESRYPMYYSLLVHKIDGRSNVEIRKLLFEEYGKTYSVEYISSLWRRRIPKLVAEQQERDFLVWYYSTQERGRWKRCSRCGRVRLAHTKFFSRNESSLDGWYSICKDCRNERLFVPDLDYGGEI